VRQFSVACNYFPEWLAKAGARPYYSPPRNTTRRCKADVARVAGLIGWFGGAKLARRTGAKKIADLVDETKKVLHNLVSLLQTTQRAERQSRQRSSLTTKQPISVGAG